jgi:hypothetical protein
MISNKRVFAFTLLFLIGSCSSLVPDPNRKNIKSKSYSFEIDDDLWEKTEPDTSDHAYLNPDSGSYFIINSLCKKYQNASLGKLSSSIISGISNLKISDKKTLLIHNREGIVLVGEGKLDGVVFKLKILTFQKDRCTYDFALLSPGKGYTVKESHSFDSLITSVEFD